MMFFNHSFVVNAISTNKSLISSQEKQKLSIFTNWRWTLIIWALCGVAGAVWRVVLVLLSHIEKDNFFEEVWKDIKDNDGWLPILICTGIGLIYGLLPSGCHFFWRWCKLRGKQIGALIWLIAFWVLVGFCVFVILSIIYCTLVFALNNNTTIQVPQQLARIINNVVLMCDSTTDANTRRGAKGHVTYILREIIDNLNTYMPWLNNEESQSEQRAQIGQLRNDVFAIDTEAPNQVDQQTQAQLKNTLTNILQQYKAYTNNG